MPVYHKPTPRPGGARKCSVCLEDVMNPKRLACDHSFCHPCLRHQISRLSVLLDNQERVSIVCPDCRDYFLSSVSFLDGSKSARGSTRTKSPVLTRAKTIHGHVTEYGAHYCGDRKAERCDPCAEGAMYELATFWCQNCSEYLCSLCAKYHQAMKMSKDHIVKTIRDKERYGSVRAKVNSTPRPQSAREVKEKSSTKVFSQHRCEPCSQSKKTKDAKFLCDTCKEQMCDECARCHQSMKMSKSHKLMPIKEVLSKSETSFSLSVKCDRHYGEVLSLYCKRCMTSCCSICAITVHNSCGKAMKMATVTSVPVGKVEPTTQRKDGKWATVKDTGPIKYSWDKVGKDLGEDKTVSFSISPATSKTKAMTTKYSIPKNRMEVRKRRIEIGANREKDWVISMALLTTGDILLIQLYEPTLKMIDPDGGLISTCKFYGDPWSVGVYNDSLAVVSFSDRKQLQLIHITRNGLEIGKKFATRHKCLAVCFAKNLIAASCWEGCIHVMAITGDEMCTIDSDHRGDRLFTNPEYIAADALGTTLYVSDYKRDTVTALTLLPSKIISKPVFVFKDKELQGPKGVATDKNGAVYVSGMSSRNIFRLSSTGDVIQIYRRRVDTDYYEAVVVSRSCERMYVSAYEDNTIIQYKLSK